jgi:hypothetical protein
MTERVIKKRLAGTLNAPISGADWRYLKGAFAGPYRTLSDAQFVDEAEEDWDYFVAFARKHLWLLRCRADDITREQAGELDPETEPERAEKPSTNVPLRGRAFARHEALGALNLLRTDGRSAGKGAIRSALFPRGGVDGTLGQWVQVIAVELWVPAEEVANHIRRTQRAMLAESSPPKTSERAFEVAAFVWDIERAEGKRPPWRVLCERWNNWPLTGPFDDWRHFHKTFTRGSRATPPRYVASNEQITRKVRSGAQDTLDHWAAKIRD